MKAMGIKCELLPSSQTAYNRSARRAWHSTAAGRVMCTDSVATQEAVMRAQAAQCRAVVMQSVRMVTSSSTVNQGPCKQRSCQLSAMQNDRKFNILRYTKRNCPTDHRQSSRSSEIIITTHNDNIQRIYRARARQRAS